MVTEPLSYASFSPLPVVMLAAVAAAAVAVAVARPAGDGSFDAYVARFGKVYATMGEHRAALPHAVWYPIYSTVLRSMLIGC